MTSIVRNAFFFFWGGGGGGILMFPMLVYYLRSYASVYKRMHTRFIGSLWIMSDTLV